MKKKIIILGSTGSIGDSALKVLDRNRDDFEVVGLSTESNIEKLYLQIKKWKPRCVGIVNPVAYSNFIKKYESEISRKRIKVYSGVESLERIVKEEADLILSGVVGASGLMALLAALKLGRVVALANKESLIMAGELVTETAKKYGGKILPVDSEHSAMFQCLEGQNGNKVYKILLTASGGPFYKYKGDLSKVSVEYALKHPNWIMGKKITIDSATLMNKGLEKIEAHYLFGVPLDKIEILIHRQSIVHSAVEYEDGSVLAQLSAPDMCLPIQYALTYPERKPCPIARLDLAKIKQLDFEFPDFNRFPALSLALSAAKSGGTTPAALSAANEVAVYAFLAKRIRFTEIAKVVEIVLDKHKRIKKPGLEEILDADRWARSVAEEYVRKYEGN